MYVHSPKCGSVIWKCYHQMYNTVWTPLHMPDPYRQQLLAPCIIAQPLPCWYSGHANVHPYTVCVSGVTMGGVQQQVTELKDNKSYHIKHWRPDF